MNLKWWHYALGGVVVVGVGYGISKALTSATLDAPAQPYPHPTRERVLGNQTGNAEERIASGAFGLADRIVTVIGSKVARDDAARERERERQAANHSRDMDKTSLLGDDDNEGHDYDPIAAFARKHAGT